VTVKKKFKRIVIKKILIFFLLLQDVLVIQENEKKVFAANLQIPTIQIGVSQTNEPENVTVLLQIIALLTVLTLAPAILVLMTSFTRLAVTFSFLRQALGTHQMPPNQVMIGLALFLTFFIMMPVWTKINEKAITPYLNKEMTQIEALKVAIEPIRDFMLKQTRKKDLALFVKLSELEKPNESSGIPITVLIPAFVISELKTAFIIGFFLYVPFLIIDMVVASVLLSMGMMMLPPIMISMPFKLILFVLMDGWNLIVGSLVKSFTG
jgi:flagellar biosynthetic protein FliP